MILGVSVSVCGCQDVQTVWTAEAPSPDGYWLATADTVQHSGPGTAGAESSVYLKHIHDPSAPLLILGFFHHEKNLSDTINLTMKWETPTHLAVTYDGRAASLEFQAVKCGGVEISIRDVSSELFTLGSDAKPQHPPNPSQEESVRRFLQDQLGNPLLRNDETTRYVAAFVDLKDDGTQEVIVYITGRNWCGSGGCNMLILAPQLSAYRVVTKTTITRPPIRVLTTKSNGWHDIAVRVVGGGIIGGYDAKLSFDGRKYPSNPTVPPARRVGEQTPGTVVIPVAAEGKPLF